jgi:hypothetical protein
VRVAKARADGQAFVDEAQLGQRLVVKRTDLGLPLGRLLDGSGHGAPHTREADTPSVSQAHPTASI